MTDGDIMTNMIMIDYAALYGVKPSECDFSGAIERSLKEGGPKHLTQDFLKIFNEYTGH